MKYQEAVHSLRRVSATPQSTITPTSKAWALYVRGALRLPLISPGVPINDHGFTLIELLVVVALISILAAIAVPQFSAYRQRGYDAQASSDLRNAALAQEASFATSSTYVSCSDRVDCMAKLPGFAAANDTVITMTNNGNASFNGSAKSALGSGATCRWDSAAAGFKGCS